jgi:hypothetical protein
MAAEGPPDRDGAESGAARQSVQAALVVLCVLGLVLAALAAPSLGAGGGGAGGGEGTGDTGGTDTPNDGDDGESVGVGPGLLDLLRWLFPDQQPEPRPDEPACSITVEPEPVPGRTVTLTVRREREPVEGALVRVEGDSVGRTDADGEVRATVPYVRRLSVVATFPDDSRCRATTDTGTVRDASLGGGAVGAPAAVAVGTGGDVTARQSTPNVSDDGRNVSRTYDVGGEVRIGLRGAPDPGATVTVLARVAGEPMRNATVSVDGRSVGRTDDAGRYDLTVPADGSRRVRLRVERGEFAGERTVVVRLLSARVEPVGLLSFPGSPVAVRARLGEGPATDARVTLDGRRLGRTGTDGRLRFALPPAPDRTVTVRTGGQTASAGLWLPYAATAVVLGLPALVLSVAGALAYSRRVTAGRVGRRAGGLLRRLGAGLLAVALWVTTGLGRVLDWLLARGRTAWGLLARLLTRAREDWRAVPRALVRVLSALGGRAWRALRGGWRWIGALPGRLWRWLREPSTGGPSSEATGGARVGGGGSSPFDLRGAWRTVARRVVPVNWRTRTPGEVVGAATASGVPREPVERLAAVFEEVEYGGRPLSSERRARARAAFEALLAHWRDPTEEGEEA